MHVLSLGFIPPKKFESRRPKYVKINVLLVYCLEHSLCISLLGNWKQTSQSGHYCYSGLLIIAQRVSRKCLANDPFLVWYPHNKLHLHIIYKVCLIYSVSNQFAFLSHYRYRISANSFRGNYSFLKVEVRKLFKGGNYSREETIVFFHFLYL